MLSLEHYRSVVAPFLGCPLTPEIAVAIERAAFEMPQDVSDPDRFGSTRAGAFTIRAERLSETFDEIHALHLLHWAETEQHRHGLKMSPRYDLMLARERTGVLHQFTARQDGGPIAAHIRMYASPSLHTGQLIAHEDTLFLAPAYRPNAFLMLALMRFVEASMRSLGCVELECNSKLVNKADVLMRRLGYRAIATQFHKILTEPLHV